MERTMTRTLKNSALYVTYDGKYCKFASCNPVIEVTEDKQMVTVAGAECVVRSCHAALVICRDVKYEFFRPVDIELLKEIQSFSLEFEELESVRKIGKKFIRGFDDIIPTDIDLNGEWRFDVTKHLDDIKGLFPNLVFD